MSGLPERLERWTVETVRDLAARLIQYPQFLNLITQLRSTVQSLNTVIETSRTSVAVHPQGAEQFRIGYRLSIESLKGQIKSLAPEALAEVEKIVG
jgi:hypothetical protein